jgi:hypothetical protein
VSSLPGGGPQGTILGMFLFLILINFAWFEDYKEPISNTLCRMAGKRKPLEKNHRKYDFSILEAVDGANLVKDHQLPFPLNFHSRTEQVLPVIKFRIALAVDDLKDYFANHQMKINEEKSKVMLFNTSTINDFTPVIKINDTQLEVVEQMKLLRVVLTSDVKWAKNTEYITTKGFSRLWMMRRLMRL